MPWLLNIIYLILLLLAAPWLLYRRYRAGKKIGGLHAKLTGNVITNASPVTLVPGAAVQNLWLHAVSVGEVILLQPIIKQLKQLYPHADLYLSVTTATGRDVAEQKYPDLPIIWFPFDFSWAVRKALRQIQPSLIILAELELWPNFITIAKQRGIPVVVVNGRMSERSFKGYQRLRWLTKKLLSKIDCFAVQQQEYADRLIQLGMPQDRLLVTGSVKFDGVTVDRHDPAVQKLRALFNINEQSLVWVVGSTQTPEEVWVLDIYREAKKHHPNLTLIIVPRHQERFEDVANLLTNSGLPYQRRSRLTQDSALRTSSDSALRTQHSGLFLADSLGELRTIWGLADLGFVGGSFNDRGGQNMIEPAAYGVAVTFGPNTWNFKQIVRSLLEQQAAIEVKTKDDWQATTLRLLADAHERHALGERAQHFVAGQQGATQRTMEMLKSYLDMPYTNKRTRKVA